MIKHFNFFNIKYLIGKKKKINIIKTINGINFVDGYIHSGKLHPIKGIEKIQVPKEDSEEFKFAVFLKEKLGGRIDMVPRIEMKKGTKKKSTVQTPDYMWNNETWDIKGINGHTKNTIGHKFEQYKNQTNNIILFPKKTKMSDKEICNYIQRELIYHKKYYDKAIYINRKKEIIIFENKK